MSIRFFTALSLLLLCGCGKEKPSIPGCPDQWPWNNGTLYEIVTASGDTLYACNLYVQNASFGGQAPCADAWLRGGGRARICESYVVREIQADPQ